MQGPHCTLEASWPPWDTTAAIEVLPIVVADVVYFDGICSERRKATVVKRISVRSVRKSLS